MPEDMVAPDYARMLSERVQEVLRQPTRQFARHNSDQVTAFLDKCA